MDCLADNDNKIGRSPHIVCRYANDSLCVFDLKDKMDQFLYNLNKIPSRVSFSKEVEQADNWHICMFYWQKLILELKQLSTGKALI